MIQKETAWINANAAGRNFSASSRAASVGGGQYKMVTRCHFVDRQFNIAGNSRNFNGVFDHSDGDLSYNNDFDEAFDYHWWYQCSNGYWAERTGFEGNINQHNVINPEVESLWWQGDFGYLSQGLLSPYSIAGEFRDIRGSYMYYKINIRTITSV